MCTLGLLVHFLYMAQGLGDTLKALSVLKSAPSQQFHLIRLVIHISKLLLLFNPSDPLDGDLL